jgi:hypothetical protein
MRARTISPTTTGWDMMRGAPEALTLIPTISEGEMKPRHESRGVGVACEPGEAAIDHLADHGGVGFAGGFVDAAGGGDADHLAGLFVAFDGLVGGDDFVGRIGVTSARGGQRGDGGGGKKEEAAFHELIVSEGAGGSIMKGPLHLWRYRLRVRTRPSQGLNTGSNPVSATMFS